MSEQQSPQQTVIACISNSVSFMLGRGARAAMRMAGKEASKEIWPELPENTSFEEVAKIMHDGVASLEGFGEFNLTQKHDDGTFEIEFKDCGFARFTAESGQPCGEQAICFFGFGLVEETLHRLTGQKMQVQLVDRDDACDMCHEKAVPR